MVRRLTTSGLALLLMVLAVPAASAQTLDEVLERHFEATGGESGWRALQTMRASGTLAVAGMQGTFNVVQKRPAMYRLDIEMQGMQIIQAYDGETAWQVNPMAGISSPQEADAATAELILENADLDGPLIGWREDGHQVELLGRETVDGKEAFKLEVVANGNTSQVYLDAESYQIVRTESATGGMPATATMGDPREIGGLTFPFTIDIDAGGFQQSLLFDTVEINVDVDDGQFAMGGR